MSIDAQIIFVARKLDGSGTLDLIDRPGESPGIAGQKTLHFKTSTSGMMIGHLSQACIWGGSDSIMLGDRKIAKRVSYTKIEFVSESELNEAIRVYWENHG